MAALEPPEEDSELLRSLLGPAGPLGSSWARISSAVGGLHRCQPVVIGSMLLALGLGYGYLHLLRSTGSPVVLYTLLVLAVGCLVTGVCLLVGCVLSGNALEWWEDQNLLFRQFDEEAARGLSTAAGVVFILAGMLALFGHVLARRVVHTASGCVEAAFECATAMPSLLLLPLIEAVWKILAAAFLISGFTWLLSTERMRPNFIHVRGEQVGGLTHRVEFSTSGKAMAVFYLFGLVWMLELAGAVSQFVASYTVVLWYYTQKPKVPGPRTPLLRGLIVGSVFHLGSLALGALVLPALRPFRALVRALARPAKPGGSQLAEAALPGLGVCTSFFQKHLQHFTDSTYLEVCISSTSFCTAARKSFDFLESEGGQVALLRDACSVFRFAGVLGIAAVTGAFTFLMLAVDQERTSETSPHHVANPHFAAAVAALLAGSVAQGFAVVYDHIADVLLYVYAWNKYHAHNTVQKYSPEALTRLTGYQPLTRPQTPESARQRQGSEAGGMLTAVSTMFSGFSAWRTTSEEQQAMTEVA